MSNWTSFPIELPNFASTEAAEDYGREMTRDQWIFLDGARAAFQSLFDETRSWTLTPAAIQFRADLATKIQLIREAQEVAPFPTLVAILLLKKESALLDS